jgi:hypothetical protein
VRRFSHWLFVFGLALLLAGVVSAQDKKDDKKPDPPKPPAFSIVDFVFRFPPQIKLSEEQEKKIAALKKEYGPKFDEIQKKSNKIMTPERQKAASEAAQKAIKEGKKGKEVQEAVEEALNLSKEEKAQLNEINQASLKLFTEAQKKKDEVLTDEQREQLKPKPRTDK